MFTGKAYWGDAGDKNYLCGGDKDDLLTNLKLLRDSPSQEAFAEREQQLLDTTKELFVRPGRITKPVAFHTYYERNWKSCSFRWVYAYRKNLPTKGVNDTQAAESTFRAIKHYAKIEFGRKTPSLQELILVLPKILDKRSAERAQVTDNRRVVYHHKIPEFERALEQGSWELNAGGMKAFYEALNMANDLKDRFKIEGDDITETYTGRNTAPYIGRYKTNGFVCNCSWFSSRKLCRHPFAYRIFHDLPLYEVQIFHSSFLLNPPNLSMVEDIDALEESHNTGQSEPGSPGMEHLLEEEKRANLRLKKNVKFNRAFDTAKVAAEYLSKYETNLFEKNLKAFQQFTDLLRVGLPDELIKLLNNEKVTFEPAAHSEASAVQVANVANVREVPEQLRYFLGSDFLIYSIPGDGSCLYGSASAHIYHDEHQVSNLRRFVHVHIYNNWWYYSQFIPFPFKETVGVGESKIVVELETEAEYLDFLLSDRSMKCFGNSVDVAAISNMLNINIGVFTHGIGGGIQPRWTWQYPDPVVSAFTEFSDPSITDLFLYHSDENHYELLVPRHSRLAVEGNVPTRLLSKLSKNNTEKDITPANLPTMEERLEDLARDEAEFERIVQGVPKPSITDQFQTQALENGISPMVFKPCPRGPGRPKLTRSGAPSKAPKKAAKRPRADENDHEIDFLAGLPRKEVPPPPKRSRGRPKGSKNKQTEPRKDTARERAEKAATIDNDDEVFFDSGDICNICEFPLNHRLKRNITKTTCAHCSAVVHTPCYNKSGCTCQI